MPTASSVVADLIDVLVGRAAPDVPVAWTSGRPTPCRRDWPRPSQVRSRYYLRFSIADRPGVIGRVAQILGRHGISIASVIQHDPGDDDHPEAPVPPGHHDPHGRRGRRPAAVAGDRRAGRGPTPQRVPGGRGMSGPAGDR